MNPIHACCKGLKHQHIPVYKTVSRFQKPETLLVVDGSRHCGALIVLFGKATGIVLIVGRTVVSRGRRKAEGKQ